MVTNGRKSAIEKLIRAERWPDAEIALRKDLDNSPGNHWLWTQLAVAFYEQRRFTDALAALRTSWRIKPNCPLTLWNTAGTLDAMGSSAKAIAIYQRLLRSRDSAKDDPCWESKDWTESLKTDCLFRIGKCYQHLGNDEYAERWLRKYVDLLLEGRNGSYSVDAATTAIRALSSKRSKTAFDTVLKEVQSEAPEPDSAASAIRGRWSSAALEALLFE